MKSGGWRVRVRGKKCKPQIMTIVNLQGEAINITGNSHTEAAAFCLSRASALLIVLVDIDIQTTLAVKIGGLFHTNASWLNVAGWMARSFKCRPL